MKPYRPPSHRPAFAVAALAMTVLTIALSVAVPATLSPAARTLAAGVAQAAAPIDVVISPARLDIVAVREAKVAAEASHDVAAKRDNPG